MSAIKYFCSNMCAQNDVSESTPCQQSRLWTAHCWPCSWDSRLLPAEVRCTVWWNKATREMQPDLVCSCRGETLGHMQGFFPGCNYCTLQRNCFRKRFATSYTTASHSTQRYSFFCKTTVTRTPLWLFLPTSNELLNTNFIVLSYQIRHGSYINNNDKA